MRENYLKSREMKGKIKNPKGRMQFHQREERNPKLKL